MTYYELISKLDYMTKQDNIDDHINEINNASISLNGLRYERFIGQIEYVLTRRMKVFMKKLSEKIYFKNMSDDEFILELSMLNNEINIINKIINIKMVKDENKKVLVQSVNHNINEMIDELSKIIDKDSQLMELEKYRRSEG